MGKHKERKERTPNTSPTPVAKVQPQPPVKTASILSNGEINSILDTIEDYSIVNTPVVDTPVTPSLPEGEVWNVIKSSLNNLSPELRAQAEKAIEKIRADAERNINTKRFGAFNTELEKELPVFMSSLAEKYVVSLAGRKISIAYPTDGGSPKATHTPIGAKSGNGGNGGGNGFPTGWGKAKLVGKEGKVTEYKSPGELANSLHLQIQGMRDMLDVFKNPRRAVTKEQLPKVYEVDAVRGDHFIVKVIA